MVLSRVVARVMQGGNDSDDFESTRPRVATAAAADGGGGSSSAAARDAERAAAHPHKHGHGSKNDGDGGRAKKKKGGDEGGRAAVGQYFEMDAEVSGDEVRAHVPCRALRRCTMP
jgi:hypothetical protein